MVTARISELANPRFNVRLNRPTENSDLLTTLKDEIRSMDTRGGRREEAVVICSLRHHNNNFVMIVEKT